MQAVFIQYVYLILIILALIMIANNSSWLTRLYWYWWIGAQFDKGIFQHHHRPGFNLLHLLPPLLYESAWQVSWKEFWRWKRVIISFAFRL